MILGVGPALPADPPPGNPEKIIKVEIGSEQDAATLESLGLDVWTCSGSVGVGSIPVRVSPPELQRIEQAGLPYSTWIDDVGPLVAAQRTRLRGAAFHESYHTLGEIETELQLFAALYPGLAQIVDFGDSVQGRDLLGLRITGAVSPTTKPGLLIHGGQHAREWISPAVTLYVIDWLLTNYLSDPTATRLMDDVEWFILPVLNPDGYLYTWTTNRMWRKNRRDNLDGSFGVDLNRNWSVGWGGPGSSGSPSTDTYRGTAAFSESETATLADFIVAHPNIVGYIDFHSYAEKILWPWGYTSTHCPDHDAFNELGIGMNAGIFAVNHRHYDYGPIHSTLYATSGRSGDWVYGAHLDDRFIAGVSIELRDTGIYGFLLPPDQIIPTSEENLRAVLFLAASISEPLHVELLSPVPNSLNPGESLTVTARITPRTQLLAADGARVRFRVTPGAFFSTPMTALGGDLYEITLPYVGCGDHLEFYIFATSVEGETAAYPAIAPIELVAVPVGVPVNYSTDDLEIMNGWTAGVAGDNASTGTWVRVDPVGTQVQPEDDHTPPPGTMCYVTGQGVVGGAAGAADLDGGETTLLSPLFDVPSDAHAVSYARWFFTGEPTTPSKDYLEVSVSNDGGTNWSLVEKLIISTNGWSVHSFKPAELGLAPTNQMRLRFVAADFGVGSIVEAAIDDVIVSMLDCVNGDYNADGQINLTDHAAFVECLNGPLGESLPPQCEPFNFNADTDVDMDDYRRFMLRFLQE